MKNTLLFIILLIIPYSMKGQSVKEDFIQDIQNVYLSKTSKHKKRMGKALKEASIGNELHIDTKIVDIPVIFSTKEATRKCQAGQACKNDLLTYMKPSSMSFDEAYVYRDSSYIGMFSIAPYDMNTIEFTDENTRLFLVLQPILNNLLKLNPELIFRIYNLPYTYWYIKNESLHVLVYEHKGAVAENIRTYKANDYIRDILKDEDIWALYYKRVFVVSGK